MKTLTLGQTLYRIDYRYVRHVLPSIVPATYVRDHRYRGRNSPDPDLFVLETEDGRQADYYRAGWRETPEEAWGHHLDYLQRDLRIWEKVLQDAQEEVLARREEIARTEQHIKELPS